ncbi:hypothetical protein ABZ815_20360 [Nonomuraea sp. NPDC047529]|uniref:hypothetical protein n=1 Tax=Nonomuraea sp. NPDC047529 TaxID=3155623 RepID=UPI0033E9D9F6
MPPPDGVLQQVADAAATLNRILHSARIEPLAVRVLAEAIELDGRARQRISSAMLAMPDGMARTLAVSAWAVFAEVLYESGRCDQARPDVLRVYLTALTDHAHMIEGATAVAVVETAMRQGLPQAAAPRGQHHRP